MIKKIKISKLAVVLFLTVLIWVWADLSLDDTRSYKTATIVIGNTRRNLLVSFSEGSSIDVNEITLKGPASQINDIDQKINENPEMLQFPLVIEDFEEILEDGPHTLKIQDILEQSNWMKKSGLTIDSCDPCEVSVNVVTLEERNGIEVQCYDNSGLLKELEKEQTITMFVPSNWQGSARVDLLNDQEVQRATQQEIPKKPYIRLATGLKKEAETAVMIKLSPEADPRKIYDITATMGYTFSENLLGGRYNIDIKDKPRFLTFKIRATLPAKDAYEEQGYQIKLPIYDVDIDKSREDFVRRELNYNLPEEYVRKNEIELTDDKATVQFKITPINPAEN